MRIIGVFWHHGRCDLAKRISKDRPLRVLHIVHGLHVGGINRTLLRNAQSLQERNVEIHVGYVLDRHDMVDDFSSIGISPVSLGHRSQWHAPRTAIRALRLIRQIRPDVVHNHTWFDQIYAGLACKLARVPLVSSVHTLVNATPYTADGSLPPGGLKTRLGGAVLRFSQRSWSRKFIAVSDSVKAAYVEDVGVPDDRVVVLKTGIPEKATSSTSDRGKILSNLGLSEDAQILISVGRLMPSKNHLSLVPVVEQLLTDFPNLHLLIVGHTDDPGRFEAAISKSRAASHVHLLGSRSDVPDLLAASDVFVTATRVEGLPTAVIEACQAGIPLVASNIGPIREVVADGSEAMLCDPTQPRQFLDAIRYLLKDRRRALEMASLARERVKRDFNQDRYIDDLIALYKSVAQLS